MCLGVLLTLNNEMEVSIVLSSSVGNHTCVLAFMGKHGILDVEHVPIHSKAGMCVLI